MYDPEDHKTWVFGNDRHCLVSCESTIVRWSSLINENRGLRADSVVPTAHAERLPRDQKEEHRLGAREWARCAGTGPSGQLKVLSHACLAEAVDHVCTIVGTEFEQLVDWKSHQDAKCFAELRQRIVHYRLRLIDVAHLAKSSD